MDLNHEWKVIGETPKPAYRIQTHPAKKPHLTLFKVFFSLVAVIFSIVLVAIGISWLASVVTVLVSGKLLGYTVFFGIPPYVLSILITSVLYIVYWPVALITKGFWSLAKMKNRYKNHEIITGAILLALAIAAVIIIAVNLGKDIHFDYRDTETRIIIDDGNICVSDENYCVKY